MIKDFAEGFWRRRAQETDGSIRWTDPSMLAQDQRLLAENLPPDARLLDLGCGTGDLFAPFLDRLSQVTAVDMVPEFVERLPADPRVVGVVSDLLNWRPELEHDVAVLFGVVTHLSAEDEASVYAVLRRAVRPGGTVLVKNQCATGEELLVDRWSPAFDQRYVGRYPAVEEQRAKLARVFGQVSVQRYPVELNPWPETAHVAFVCW